ncbi:MAG: flagellar basal body-associated FliL family protein [Firmicutes bacterium]|nr:flagellar basal body-associated FliL family protein [Bacillota bacterium]
MGNRVLTVLLALLLVIVLAGGAAIYFLVLAPGIQEPIACLIPEVFVTDLADRGHIRVEINVELADKRYISELERQEMAVNDAVYRILRSNTREELSGADGQDRLRQDLLAALREIVGHDNLRNLYFKQIVID